MEDLSAKTQSSCGPVSSEGSTAVDRWPWASTSCGAVHRRLCASWLVEEGRARERHLVDSYVEHSGGSLHDAEKVQGTRAVGLAVVI